MCQSYSTKTLTDHERIVTRETSPHTERRFRNYGINPKHNNPMNELLFARLSCTIFESLTICSINNPVSQSLGRMDGYEADK